MKRRAVFFDRDGTLMQEVDYCSQPEDVQVFPNVPAALKKLREKNWLRILVTNQSGIGRGYFSLQDYEAVHTEFMHQIDHEIDAAYFCPDSPEAATPRRKPGIGMLLEATEAHDIDLSTSWMIGDKPADMLAGKSAGTRGILVKTGYGKNQSNDCPPHWIADDAVQAIEKILQEFTAL
ncbi:MAG: D-glycero-alpha-D-manno-heptose-1,7-bisphosphate 7-phosphatase [Chthoniobacterales bacterium]